MPVFFHVTKNSGIQNTSAKNAFNSTLQWMEITTARHRWSKTIKVLECSILSQKKLIKLKSI